MYTGACFNTYTHVVCVCVYVCARDVVFIHMCICVYMLYTVQVKPGTMPSTMSSYCVCVCLCVCV